MNTLSDQRRAEMGNDQTALEERRRVQKLVQSGDELDIPDLVGYLDRYLSQGSSTPEERLQKKAFLPSGAEAAVGLGKLCSIGSTKRYPVKCLFGADATIEELLLHALVHSQNQMQCAAADAIGRIGTLVSQGPLQEAVGAAGHPGDKSASVRARAKIALRRVDMRLGGRDLSAVRSIKTLTPAELDNIFHQACDGEPELELAKPKDSLYRVTVTLTGDVADTDANRVDRVQHVFIQINNQHSRSFGRGVTINSDYIVLFTACGPVTEAAYRTVLQMNALRLKPESLPKQPFGFTQGSLGIFQDEFVMIDTQATQQVTRDSIYNGIRVLATLGDEIERKLTGGADRSEDEVEEKLIGENLA